MRNLRYLVRLTSAFLSRFKAIISIGIVFGVIIFFVFSYVFPKFAGWETTKIGVAGRFSTNSLPINILQKIGSGLTKLDEAGNVLPALASSWSTPDKGKTWIFKMKEGIYWQNGTALVSRDVVYQFSDATISYPDNKTIIFSLQNPYSAFPSVVSRPIFKEGLLGTSDWKVKHLNIANDFVNQISLENNNIKENIIYKFYPTEENLKLAFELGEVGHITELLDPQPLATWKHAKISKVTDKGEYVAVFFNTTDKLLADKSLRQALSYATQKDNLGGARAISPISETSWAFNSQVKQYSYDPEKAKTMINSMDASVKSDLNITLTTSPLLLPQAELIQKDWMAVGVKTNIQVVSNIPSNYQTMLAIFDAPDDPDQYSIWHSTQTQTNITHYSNPRIDKLLEDGRTTLDVSTRKQIYYDFQRFLLEDAPTMFLYYPTVYTISR